MNEATMAPPAQVPDWDRAATARSPYLFIIGCARSGTTLLQRIVDAHPWIAVTPDMYWLTDLLKKQAGPSPAARVTAAVIAAMTEHRRFAELGIGRDDCLNLLGSTGEVSSEAFLVGLFERYGALHGKRLVGNKTPPYVKTIASLHRWWPWARFIHLIRDGRDVALSVLNWYAADRTAGRFVTWSEDPMTTLALWWKRKVRLGREAGRKLVSELYHEARYEALVARPADECAVLCTFLDVPYGPAMLQFYNRRPAAGSARDARHPWMPITPGLRDWRTQMQPVDAERFEAAAGDLLDELGYERSFPRVSDTVREHTRQITERFTRQAREQGWRLPEAW